MSEPTLQEEILAMSTKGVGIVDIADIYIPPDRMREDSPSVRKYIDEELAPSIAENGIIQPPVLHIPAEPIKADGREYHFELIAGWCRTTACRSMGLTSIPYTTRERLRRDQLLEIELEENLRRKDMTWQEKVLGIYTTHRSKQINANADGKSWGVRQTGAVLGYSHGYVQDAIKVAKAMLDNNEEVRNASNISDAIKVMYGQLEDQAMDRLAKAAGATPSAASPKKSTPSMGPVRQTSTTGISLAEAAATSPTTGPVATPVVQHDVPHFDLDNMLFNMDNREWFDQQPDNTYDLIYTDIPFGIEMDNLDFNAADLDRVADAHDVEENLEQMPVFLKNAYRVLKDKSYCVFWMDIKHWEKLVQWGKDAGFTVQAWPIVWCKEHPCRNRAAGQWWTKSIEYVMVMRKGTATLRNPQTRNWILADGSAERKMQRNPFAKPFEVSKKVLEAIVVPGMTAVDCYAGAGSLVRAMLNLGLRVKAIEKDEKHFNELIHHVKQTCLGMTRGRAEFTWSGVQPKEPTE